MHLKVNNSEDNLFSLKMAIYFVHIIARNHYTKWQCCTIKSNEVVAFFVKKKETEKLTIKDGRSKISDQMYMYL